MYKKFIAIFAAIAALFPATVIAQETIVAGNQALELWNEEGIANSPTWVQYWLVVMMLSFALGLLFVWKRLEARWVVGGLISGLLTTSFVTPALGLVNLSGLVALIHIIFWSPGLFLMLKNRPFLREKSLYKYWSGWITLVIIFSFIFDVRDSLIYLHHMLMA